MDKIERRKYFISQLKKRKYIKGQKEFGAELGYENESYFSQIINGKVQYPEDLNAKIKSLFPDVNTEWLDTGIGSLWVEGNITAINNGTVSGTMTTAHTIINNTPASPITTEEAGEVEEPEEVEAVPVVPRSIYTEPNVNILEYVQNNDVQMSPRIHQLSQYDLCYMVVNDEMAPYICAGDRIYLWAYPEGKERKIIDGRVYSVDTKLNGVLTRQLYKLENGFLAKSFNPRYADEVLEWEDIYRVYRIVGVLRMDE
jgi:hypothetical protein